MYLEKKIKLYANPLTIFISLIVLAIIVAGAFSLMWIFYPPKSVVEKSIVISIFCLVELIPCVGIIVSYQTAWFDNVGITFKVAIWKKAMIRWNEIVKIDIQELDTWYSWIKIYKKKWIIFHTNNQTPKGVFESYQMICSIKNLTSIVNISKKINLNIDMDALISCQKNHIDS